jgi:surface polysaccharide O-acyltransferase-like enzyme
MFNFTKPALSWDWQVMNMWHGIFRWPVPLFVMISGMFNIERFDREQPLKTGIKKILKKILRIYCALFFWAIFYEKVSPALLNNTVSDLFVNPLTFSNGKEIIRDIYRAIGGGSSSYFHLWFLYMIIGLYIITPFVKLFVENCTKEHLEYFLAVVFLIGMGVPFYNFVNELRGIPLLPHKIHIALPELSGYLGYYIAGYYLSKYRPPKKAEYALYILGIASTVFTIAATSFISIKQNNLNSTLLLPMAPQMMFETAAVFLFIKNKFEYAEFSARCSAVITSISKCSFGIYLIHLFMIRFVNIYFKIKWDTFNPVISVPLICAAAFLLSYSVSLILSKIPLLKKYIL